MAKKKRPTIRKSIRINGELIQNRFTSPEDAADWYAVQLRKKKRIEAGLDESLGPQIITVSEYAKIFMRRRVVEERVVKGTWRSDGQRFEDYILPLMGDKVLQSIKSNDWSEALNLIQSNPLKVLKIALSKASSIQEKEKIQKKINAGRTALSNTTRNRIRTLINTMYNESIKVDKISLSNPMAQVDVKDEGDHELKSDYWESTKECREYLEAHKINAEESGHYGYWLWAVFSIYSGARVGELLALKHEDINLDQGKVRINKIYDPNVKADVYRTKGSRKSQAKGRKRSSRWLYLTGPILAVYELHVQHTPYNRLTDHVFMNTRDSAFSQIKNQGTRSTLSGITRVHKMMCEQSGVRELRVHDVRHTFGAQYMMRGGNITALAKILGHSSQWITERYGHLSEAHISKEVLRVSFENDVKRDATVMPVLKNRQSKSKKNRGSK